MPNAPVKAAWLSALTLTASGLLACTAPAPSAPAQGPAASDAATSQPAQPKVNRLVMGLVTPSGESNNPRHTSQTTMWQIKPMYEYLAGMDIDGKMAPQLATEWGLEGDGTGYRYKLRKGVQFHNNAGEFTAKDVVHSWKDLVLPDSLGGYQVALIRDNVETVEAVNDYEVFVRLKKKNADVPYVISEFQGGFEIMSKADYDKVGHDPSMTESPIAGTGPYQFKSRQQGANVVYARTPFKQWRATPDFPEFEFRWMKEASTRQAALLANEVHITSLPEDLLQQAQKQNFRVIKGRVPALRTFLLPRCCFFTDPKDFSKGYLPTDSPMTDVRFRKAMNKAIDRDALNKAFFNGKGELMIVDPLHSTRPGWDPSLAEKFKTEYGYDQAAAKKLLADAGKTGAKIQLLQQPVSGFAGAEDMFEAIAGMWRQAGIDVEILTPDPATITTVNRQLGYRNHVSVAATSAGQLVSTFYHSTMETRGSKLEDADIQKVIDELFVTLDERKSADLWRQLGQVIFDKHQIIPLFWLPAEAVVNPAIVGDYQWPGAISGTWTHVENIKAAK